jgi:hypothetical protein
MLGTIAAAILLLESTIAVVVLQSSLGLCDAADLIAQLLSDCLFLGKPQYDDVSLAAEVTKNNLLSMAKVARQLEDKREPATEHSPFHEYVGRYENAIKNWEIEIGLDYSNQLSLRFQDRLDEQYSLRHYNYDVFAWNLSYDETIK